MFYHSTIDAISCPIPKPCHSSHILLSFLQQPFPSSYFLTLVTVPLFLGSIVGYRNQLKEEAGPKSFITEKLGLTSSSSFSSSSPSQTSIRPLSPSAKRKVLLKNFNPSIHAGKALLISTGLTLSSFSLLTLTFAYAMDWHSVSDGVTSARTFGRAVKTGMVEVFGESRLNEKERRVDEELIKDMTKEQESQYWSERIFGK